jgi:hypothetical protein
MGLKEDRERRADGQWWYDGETAAGLAKLILNTDGRFHLRALPGQDEHGKPTLWFQLYDGAAPGPDSQPCSAPLNASHYCPPDCT